jgi:hypothetical protein
MSRNGFSYSKAVTHVSVRTMEAWTVLLPRKSDTVQEGVRREGSRICAGVKASGERPQTVDGTQSVLTQAAGEALQVDVASSGESGESRRTRDGGT